MNKNDVIIILGTAHLATTPGKRSPDGRLREAVYSREIVKGIESRLKSEGYNVEVDYPDLQPNAQMKGRTWKEEQNRELAWRVNYVNSLCAKHGTKNCLYVSVHCNAAGNGQWMNARGWEAWTSKGQTEGDKLAECLYDAAQKCLPKGTPIRTDMTDGDRDKEGNLAVVRNTRCPAVLTENLFQDNKEDVAYMLSQAGREAIVRLHAEGIKNYI